MQRTSYDALEKCDDLEDIEASTVSREKKKNQESDLRRERRVDIEKEGPRTRVHIAYHYMLGHSLL